MEDYVVGIHLNAWTLAEKTQQRENGASCKQFESQFSDI